VDRRPGRVRRGNRPDRSRSPRRGRALGAQPRRADRGFLRRPDRRPAGGDGDRYRDNAHISLLVPREAVPEPEVAAYVDARTAVDFGTITTNEISFVAWRPGPRTANIEVIDRLTW
jgi:hypothetical protein